MLSTVVYAKEVQTVFSYSTPPFVFKDGSGIVMELMEKSLAYKSHTVKPVFVNIGRGLEMYKAGYVDASSLLNKSSGIKTNYSEYFMQYHNAIFALKKNNFKIEKLDDLSSYYFSSFQNATDYLGEEFAKVANKAKEKYSEIADQKQQVYKLLMGRTELTIMDKSIFEYYKNKLISEGKISKDIKIQKFELFKPSKFRAAFRDKQIRDDFNAGLKKLKESGKYDEIYEKYSNLYFKIKR